MTIHEMGHVVGSLFTGGTVKRIVLHPLTISRTDVSPNPNPLVVVWLGPTLGSVLPLLAWCMIPKRLTVERNMAQFIAGFCLIANGAYIGIGSIDKVGDCGEMLKHGSPAWTLLLFGALAVMVGVFVWHRLGSIKTFLADPTLVDRQVVWPTVAALVVLLTALWLLF